MSCDYREHQSVSAGVHMFGTAHAVNMLADADNFRSHPLGGVIRVDVDVQQPFARRFDTSKCVWDSDSDYEIVDLMAELEKNPRPAHIDLSDGYITQQLDFIRALTSTM
jgi:hypothetical protein